MGSKIIFGIAQHIGAGFLPGCCLEDISPSLIDIWAMRDDGPAMKAVWLTKNATPQQTRVFSKCA
jgi:hypothetical protein